MTDGLPAALLQLKMLIWVHSAFGALLLLGIPAVALVTRNDDLVLGILPCLAVWGGGYGLLRKKATELAPEERVAVNGLPLWVPPLVAVSSLLSPIWFSTPFGAWVVGAWLLLAATIAIQWGLSNGLGIPVHRKAWGAMLFALGVPLILGAVVFYLFLMTMRC